MDLRFANPWVLVLLWLVPAMGFWWFAMNRRRERALAAFMSLEMQKKLRPPHSPARFAWQAGLICAGAFCLLLAASRPQWGSREELVYRRGRDVAIVLDVSRSMLANDVYPNRLERAKVDIVDLVKELRGDRAALIAFRFKAVLLCPLTTDYAYLRQTLESVDTDSAPRGETDIADGIAKALDAFDAREGSHKAIVLISDGEDLTGRAEALAKQAGERRIPIFAVGYGSPRGSKIPELDKSQGYLKYQGGEVLSKLSNETLDAIARASGGAYVPVGTASTASTTLGALYRNRLRQIAAQDLEETLQRRYIERFQIFLLPAFLFMLAGALLSRGRLAIARPAAQADRPPADRRPLAPSGKAPASVAGIGIAVLGLTAVCSTAQTNAFSAAPMYQWSGGRHRSQADGTNATPSALAAAPSPADAAAEEAPPPQKPRITVPPGRAGARVAQKLYRNGKYGEAGDAYLQAARDAPPRSQRDFTYNAAAAYFKAGEYGRAASVLRELVMSQKTGDAPSSAGLGSALYRQAETQEKTDAAKLAERERLLRESAGAFQGAVKLQPSDQTARRNLAVTLQAIPEAEQDALIAKMMAEHGQEHPFDIVHRMLSEQRRINAEIPRAFTNDTPSQIKQLETLAASQKANANLWIPLKGKLVSAMAQGQNQQAAAIAQAAEENREKMLDAAASLRDMDTAAYTAATASEGSIYQFWKPLSPYMALLQEDLRRQSNVINMTESSLREKTGLSAGAWPEQEEATSLTKLFADRFQQQVPAGGTTNEPSTPPPPAAGPPSPGGTNTPPPKGISPETRQKVLDLSYEATKSQIQTQRLFREKKTQESLAQEQKSHDLLEQIAKLLQDQQQQQQQQQQQKPPPPPDQDKQPPPEKKEEPPPPPEKKEQAPPQEVTAEEVKKMLEKALEREKDHEEQQKRRNQQMPMAPRERDW